MSTIKTRMTRSTTAVLATGSVILLMGLTQPTAQAGEAAKAGVGAHGRAAAANTVHLKFDKNPADPSNSKLSVIKGSKVWANFRAGSGTTTNDCATGRGWLPNGTYTIGKHHRTYNGRLIKGYAIALADKVCSNGRTKRTELFIHSEMTVNGGQGSGEARKWTDKNPNDFLSNGCVKMRPEEIKKMYRLLDRIGWPKTLNVVS
ncbi:L,D-transpeptidase family protein [Streptomyces sp. NRRL F-5135]|uniref:L,D-transpeptidase family protein n=1 Tax=Streptomyces sp. NRRL F-5135 TaxID=1463858 RepID=UPI00068A4AE7|nr:L,D-transpeptidase family protein [Streptomyces sp. NRRL F-5135]